MGTNRLGMMGVLLVMVMAQSAPADTYYVATTGVDDPNDPNNGGVNDPYLTIKYGCSKLTAGDTLIIQPGTYIGEINIDLTASGSDGNEITIKAEDPNTVFIKRTAEWGGYGSDACFNINFLNAANFESDGNNPRSYVNLENLDISYYKRGVLIHQGSHHKVTGCTFTDNGGELYGSAVWFMNSSYAEVRDSRFYALTINSDPNGDPTIQDYGVVCYGTTNCLVEHCYFYGCHSQTVSFRKGSSYCAVRYCVFEGAPYTAIYLGQHNGVPNDPNDLYCSYLSAEHNVIRPAVGFPISVGICVNKVVNAVVRDNYIESPFYQKPPNGSTYGHGILVGVYALGNVEVSRNVIAFDVWRAMYFSATEVDSLHVYHNTIYDCTAIPSSRDFVFSGEDVIKTDFINNLTYISNNYASGLPESNMQLDTLDPNECLFAGPLTQPSLPTNYLREIDFEQYWDDMMAPFHLCDGDENTTSIGIDAGMPIIGWWYCGNDPDVGAFEHCPSLIP